MLDLRHLGDRIRKKRKEKMITIKTLAECTGLSVGYLSTLEQNKTSPNVESLARICEALDTKIVDILEGDNLGKTVIRKDEMLVQEYPELNMTVAVVDFKQDNKLYEYITIRPGDDAKREAFCHVLPEMATVISGVLSVEIEGKKYELYPGDSLYVESGVKHMIYNEREEPVVSVWVYQRHTDRIL